MSRRSRHLQVMASELDRLDQVIRHAEHVRDQVEAVSARVQAGVLVVRGARVQAVAEVTRASGLLYAPRGIRQHPS